MKTLGKQLISYSTVVCTCLALMGGCLTVQDKPSKKQQVKNAAKTFVEGYFLKRVEKAKEEINATYKKLHALQDSLDQARYNTSTLLDLTVSNVERELINVNELRNDLLFYVDYPAGQPYAERFRQLLQNQDVSSGADELYRMFNYKRLGEHLPTDYNSLEQEQQHRQQFLYILNEYLDKRLLTASQVYRNWADTYRQKSLELNKAVLQDKHITLTDLERIQTQRLAEKYMAYSIEFMEKSDSLLAASKESRKNIQRNIAKKRLEEHLRLQELAKK